MAGWEIVTKIIAAQGPVSLTRVSMQVSTRMHVLSAIQQAHRMGLVQPSGRGKLATWSATALGVAWVEGRAEYVERRPGGRLWRATWLESLPRGIRLPPGPQVYIP